MKLKPFQEAGRDFLAGRRYALLADEMRLGKTAQAITAAEAICAKTILVVCPAIAQTHWKTDFERWWTSSSSSTKLDVVSYDRARIDRAAFAKTRWDVLILDESHFLKNPQAARTKAILGKNGIARSAHRVWALSGTPAPNHAGELWPLMFTFGKTKLGYEPFLYRYCNIDPYSGRVRGTNACNRPELKSKLKTVMKRRLKKAVAPELPSSTLTPYYVDARLDYVDLVYPVGKGEQLSKASSLECALKETLSGMPSESILEYIDGNVAELATLRRITALLKAPALVDLLQFELDLGSFDKAVVFGYHRDPMMVARDMLRADGYRAEVLYGGTPAKKRDGMLKRFNRKDDKSTQVLFAQIIAAGTAIDLSVAHEGFLLERDWVPGNNAQALERMGGYRQTEPVTIRDLIIPGSVDDIIGQVVNKKIADLSDIFNEG